MKPVFAVLALIFAGVFCTSATAQTCATEEECMAGYTQAITDRSEPGDYVAAEAALRSACEASETGWSCQILAWMMLREVVPGEPDEVQAFFDRACELGDDRACNRLSEQLLTSDFWVTERTGDYAEKRDWIEQDCALGNDFTCRKLVRYVTEKAERRYRAACEAGDTIFCALLGGVHVYPDYDEIPKAEAIFRKLCEEGEGMGCIFLADLISSGNGSDFNETQAPHMERACDLGIVHGCNVARDIMLAKDPEASTAKRLRYLRPACEKDYLPACVRAASIERWTNDTTKIQYAMTLREDCHAGNWRSCEAAAYAFEAVRYHMDLNSAYRDPDQFIQNYFDLAEALKGR